MAASTPAAKIPRWRSQIKQGAWLIEIGDTMVSSISDAQQAFAALAQTGVTLVTLLISHPEIQQDTSHNGLPIVSSAPFTQHIHDQLNHCWDFSKVAEYLRKVPPYEIVESGNVLNYVSRAMCLTLKVLFHLLTATGKIFSMTAAHSLMPPPYMTMLILTGLHASRHNVHSVAPVLG